MRAVRFTAEADHALAAQVDYLTSLDAAAAALNLLDRVEGFLSRTIAAYPRTGRHIAERDIWETWIPGTRLVVWYVFDDETITVLTVWHSAQDRRAP